jgi:hypothetical protein
MWKRNLLFLGLLGGGIFALGANLLPPREPKPVTRYDAAAYQSADFLDAVARVDATFHKAWADDKIEPAPPASDLLVARRLSLALMGTIPSLEEIRQFEYLPPDERLAWWIDHILQDRRFADYMGERLARAYVGTEGGAFIFFRRRRFVNWLSDRIADNRPYDGIVRDLLTAKGLWTNEPATNFISVSIKQGAEGSKNQPDPVRLAIRVTRAFLGLSIDCAECHNHPYARWKQADFQALAAFFGQTHIGFTGIYDGQGEYQPFADAEKKTRKVVEPRAPDMPEAPGLTMPEHGTRRERLAAWVTSPKNRYFSQAIVNRVWALLFGLPLRDPVDNLESESLTHPALAILADDFVEHNFDLRRLIRVIASTKAFRLDSAAPREMTEDDEAAWAVFPLTRLRPEQVAGSIIQASNVKTINSESHIFVRLARFGNQNDFLQRYGDTGEDEFSGRGGTIPQRLLLMNGSLTRERIKADLFTASSRISSQAPNDRAAVEAAYLTLFTRRPTPPEAEHFEGLLADRSLGRPQRLEDLFWTLINSTEFSWNH